MSNTMLAAALSLALAACPLAASAQASPAAVPVAAAQDPGMSAGRELSRLFLARDTAAVWARMGAPMREALGSADALAQFRAQLARDLGEEQSLLDEQAGAQSGLQVYIRVARWSKAPMPIEMQWAVDAQGQVQGFFVRPKPEAAPSPHLDYRTRAHLRLPFDGAWYVFWGGRTIEQNYHAAVRGQRFAYDLVKRVDGSTHRGDGKALDDYYCWNQPILAPADATVLEAVDGLPDQAIGTRNTEAIAGNHVMLDLGQGEYALLAHLRRGSVAVKPGQHVARGETIGRCGNSGNTSEPHLHFHLQDAPEFGKGDGLPASFEDYSADGKPVERGEPVQGQTIAPIAGAAVDQAATRPAGR
ncbi:MAG TPA: M23 family metallopeptidase [Luteimonas sp.]|nr:M23 family metallopeptidase [Luteimonas sp.]